MKTMSIGLAIAGAILIGIGTLGVIVLGVTGYASEPRIKCVWGTPQYPSSGDTVIVNVQWTIGQDSDDVSLWYRLETEVGGSSSWIDPVTGNAESFTRHSVEAGEHETSFSLLVPSEWQGGWNRLTIAIYEGAGHPDDKWFKDYFLNDVPPASECEPPEEKEEPPEEEKEEVENIPEVVSEEELSLQPYLIGAIVIGLLLVVISPFAGRVKR